MKERKIVFPIELTMEQWVRWDWRKKMETVEKLLWLKVKSRKKLMEEEKLSLAVLNQCLAQEYYDFFGDG